MPTPSPPNTAPPAAAPPAMAPIGAKNGLIRLAVRRPTVAPLNPELMAFATSLMFLSIDA